MIASLFYSKGHGFLLCLPLPSVLSHKATYLNPFPVFLVLTMSLPWHKSYVCHQWKKENLKIRAL